MTRKLLFPTRTLFEAKKGKIKHRCGVSGYFRTSLFFLFFYFFSFLRICARLFGVCTTSWCTLKTASRDYCTPHGSVFFFEIPTLERASCWYCSRAQNSSVCYISVGVSPRAISRFPQADNHIMTAHTENHVENPFSGATSRGRRTIEIRFGVTHRSG